MEREIIVPAGIWPTLKAHLLGQGDMEQLAFLLAGMAKTRGQLRLLVREAIPVPTEALDRQSSTYLAVKADFSQALLRRCYKEGLSLIEIHSHPFAYQDVTFSATDLANEAEKFRYVARKIPHICHATLVVGQSSVDGHVWERQQQRAVPIDRIRLLDTPITDLIPISSPLAGKRGSGPAHWLNRQVLAFGEIGQQRLQDVRVGVSGCGGTGSVVVQMLAHLGVQHLTLVDPDVVELTNLNRLVGATWADARRSRAKVQVARRLIRRTNPQARVQVLPISVISPQAVTALKGLDMLFGCTDNHGSRLVLNQLAVQYLIPYLDLGAGLQAGPGNRLVAAGGQVRLVRPGAFCLACIDGFDRVQAAQGLSPLAQKRRVARGYIQNADIPTPAVLFLNNAIASLAVAEFVNLWTGYRVPTSLLYFDLLSSRLTPAEAESQAECITCGQGGSLALGDLEPVPGVSDETWPDTVPPSQQQQGEDTT